MKKKVGKLYRHKGWNKVRGVLLKHEKGEKYHLYILCHDLFFPRGLLPIWNVTLQEFQTYWTLL